MRTCKKMVHLILAFLMLILSLGTATGCLFDPEINVKRVNKDVYIYNGERYIYTEAMKDYDMASGSDEIHNIGYAYSGIGQKVPVVVTNRDLEEKVIDLITDHHYPSFCHPFYVKESASFPTNLWEAKFSAIAKSADVPSSWKGEIKINFQLKEVLSLSPIYLEEDEQLSLKNEWFRCYLEQFPSLYLSLSAHLDVQNDMYITEGFNIWYKVTDKNFKAAVMQLCF